MHDIINLSSVLSLSQFSLTMYYLKIYGAFQLVTFLVHCHQLQLKGNVIGNNSYINYTNILNGDGTLDCLFEKSVGIEHWRDEKGIAFQQDANSTYCLFVTRGNASISLNHKTNNN